MNDTRTNRAMTVETTKLSSGRHSSYSHLLYAQHVEYDGLGRFATEKLCGND